MAIYRVVAARGPFGPRGGWEERLSCGHYHDAKPPRSVRRRCRYCEDKLCGRQLSIPFEMSDRIKFAMAGDYGAYA